MSSLESELAALRDEVEGGDLTVRVGDVESRLDDVESAVEDVVAKVDAVCEEFALYDGALADIYLAAC